jgi:hypothetical protein
MAHYHAAQVTPNHQADDVARRAGSKEAEEIEQFEEPVGLDQKVA